MLKQLHEVTEISAQLRPWNAPISHPGRKPEPKPTENAENTEKAAHLAKPLLGSPELQQSFRCYTASVSEEFLTS